MGQGGQRLAGLGPGLLAVFGGDSGEAQEVGVAVVVVGIEEVGSGEEVGLGDDTGLAVGVDLGEEQRGGDGGSGEAQTEPVDKLVGEQLRFELTAARVAHWVGAAVEDRGDDGGVDGGMQVLPGGQPGAHALEQAVGVQQPEAERCGCGPGQ